MRNGSVWAALWWLISGPIAWNAWPYLWWHN